MASFQIALSPPRRVAGRFVAAVRRTLQQAFAEEKKKNGLSQSEIARLLDIHRSVISRQLRGDEDITLGRVAELAWAMNREASIILIDPSVRDRDGSNEQVEAEVRVSSTAGVKLVDTRASSGFAFGEL